MYLKFVFIICVLLFSSSVFSVSLSTYRIYLDNDNRSQAFGVFNNEQKEKVCELNLRHVDYSDGGKITFLLDTNVPANSAKQFVRFSPKKFKMSANSRQNVNFVYRRKSNKPISEYRSLVSVSCQDSVQGPQRSQVDIKPRLVHNIPLIVRNGAVIAEAELKNITTQSEHISFEFHRLGERSLYGKLELLNKKSGEIVSHVNGFSIYPGTSFRVVNMTNKGFKPEELVLKFSEDPLYGGSLNIVQNVK